MIPIYCIPCKIIVQCSVYSEIRTNDGVWGDFCSCCKIIGNTLIHCSPLSAGISYPSTVYLEDYIMCIFMGNNISLACPRLSPLRSKKYIRTISRSTCARSVVNISPHLIVHPGIIKGTTLEKIVHCRCMPMHICTVRCTPLMIVFSRIASHFMDYLTSLTRGVLISYPAIFRLAYHYIPYERKLHACIIATSASKTSRNCFVWAI